MTYNGNATLNEPQRGPSLETARRIELILAKQDVLPWNVELRRAMRGILLLEQIDTPPARALLQFSLVWRAGWHTIDACYTEGSRQHWSHSTRGRILPRRGMRVAPWQT